MRSQIIDSLILEIEVKIANLKEELVISREKVDMLTILNQKASADEFMETLAQAQKE